MFHFRLCSAPPPPLFLSEPTSPPREVRCSAAGSTSLSVSWAPALEEQQNAAPLGYEVRYQVSGDDAGGSDSPQTLRLEPDAGRTLLTGLRRWSSYRVTVAALTEQGDGPQSRAVECRTDEDGKVSPPALHTVQLHSDKLGKNRINDANDSRIIIQITIQL